MEMGGQRHAPSGVPPGKRQEAGGTQARSGRLRQISPPIGIRSLDRSARSAMQGSRLLTQLFSLEM
jgi:hypothetical protein